MPQRLFRFLSVSFFATLACGCSSNNLSQKEMPPVAAKNIITPKGSPNFTSQVANFSIFFPVKPAEKRTPSSSEWGDFETFIYESKTQAVSYVVVASTIPSKVDTSDSITFIDGVQKGFVNGEKATLEKSREIMLNGIPGRELHTSMLKGAAMSRVYIYFTPQISYQVMAVGLKKEFQGQSAQIDKVLNSFRLLNK